MREYNPRSVSSQTENKKMIHADALDIECAEDMSCNRSVF